VGARAQPRAHRVHEEGGALQEVGGHDGLPVRGEEGSGRDGRRRGRRWRARGTGVLCVRLAHFYFFTQDMYTTSPRTRCLIQHTC